MKIMIFSSQVENFLAEKVNTWLETWKARDVISLHYSSATDTNTQCVIFSVCIAYQEYPEPNEEERIERQAQEHLEAAARHRDDPMF